MTLMAQGDASAAFALYEEFGAVIRRVLLSHFIDRGINVVPTDELDGLTLDAVFALLDAAPAWRPDGGAMPWSWAERKLRALVNNHIGHHGREVRDEDGGEMPTIVLDHDHDELQGLALVAADHDTVRLLVEALDAVCTRRDAQIFVAVRAQAAGGDPSPSNTVAAQHGMKPPAVRQVAKRARDSLRRLAESDKRFEPLLDLALLAP